MKKEMIEKLLKGPTKEDVLLAISFGQKYLKPQQFKKIFCKSYLPNNYETVYYFKVGIESYYYFNSEIWSIGTDYSFKELYDLYGKGRSYTMINITE